MTKDALVVEGLGVKAHGRAILENVSFSVRRGSTLAIVGPNGAGKTMLLKALLGVVPHEGTIRWLDGTVRGYVPQSLVSTDLPISVGEFLGLKCGDDPRKCMGYVGLGGGLLSQSLGSLSGGQLQRVLIAWALVGQPDTLLLDEPTSGVDIGAEEPIYQRVTGLKKRLGMTVLLVTHNVHVVLHYSDYVMALNRKVIFHGKTSGISGSMLLNMMYGGKHMMPRETHARLR